MILLKIYVLFICFLGVDLRECDGGVLVVGFDLLFRFWIGLLVGSVVFRNRVEFCYLY